MFGVWLFLAILFVDYVCTMAGIDIVNEICTYVSHLFNKDRA